MKKTIATLSLLAASALVADASEGLVAVLQPVGDSEVDGTVMLSESDEGITVTANVSGLTAESAHGFHIHEFGDVSSEDGKSAGGHFNPGDHDHGLPGTEERHAGDMGNLEANADGVAELSMTLEPGVVPGGIASLAGRAIVVHAEPDDGGQPTGNAGARIAVGILGIANPEYHATEDAEVSKASPTDAPPLAATGDKEEAPGSNEEIPADESAPLVATEDETVEENSDQQQTEELAPNAQVDTTRQQRTTSPDRSEKVERAVKRAGREAEAVGGEVARGMERAARETSHAMKKVGRKIENAFD